MRIKPRKSRLFGDLNHTAWFRGPSSNQAPTSLILSTLASNQLLNSAPLCIDFEAGWLSGGGLWLVIG